MNPTLIVRRLTQFASVLLCLSLFAFPAQGTASETGTARCYRHLSFNHDSPFLPCEGVCEISQEDAARFEHYEFHYDASGRVMEIRNESSENWHRHPLTHLGAWRTEFTYEGNREIRRFYDRGGNRVRNLREVWEEDYILGPDGSPVSLEFRDREGHPMESNWGIARYNWEKRQGMLIERRFNLKGAPAPLSPYFNFHISGITFDSAGHPTAHYNLNDKLEVTENENGIAFYSDIYAENGSLLEIAYHKKDGRITPSPWEYAIVRFTYDGQGNVADTRNLRPDGSVIGTETFHYDERGKFLPDNR
jgi:hypothetical protein